MVALSGAAAVARARADIGTSFLPQGYCLEHNYIWWGSIPSTGPGSGHYSTAMDAWNYATGLHLGDTNPPAGVPVYFGVSPTRTDRNKAAGDIGLSIGGGQAIFTDASGPHVGIMTLANRGAEIARPYLGWSETFLGHPIDFGATSTAALTVTPITDSKEEPEMSTSFVVLNTNSNDGLLLKGWVFAIDHAAGTIRHITLPAEVGLIDATQLTPYGKTWTPINGNAPWNYKRAGFKPINW